LQFPGGAQQFTGPVQVLNPFGQVTEQSEQLLFPCPAINLVVLAHATLASCGVSTGRLHLSK
jgi:hypothetical protein